MIQPVSEACRSGGNHCEKDLNEAIRQAETPSPIMPRPTARRVILGAAGKDRRAGRRDQQQRGFDPARTKSVEHDPEREPGRRQKQESRHWSAAQIRGAKRHFFAEHRTDDSICCSKW